MPLGESDAHSMNLKRRSQKEMEAGVGVEPTMGLHYVSLGIFKTAFFGQRQDTSTFLQQYGISFLEELLNIRECPS